MSAAHELGTIRTLATFRRDGTYRIELTIDREHLPPGFTAAPPPGPARAMENLSPALESRIGPILERAAAGTRIAFDGRPVVPRIAVVPPPGVSSGEGDAALAAAAEVALALTGPIPPGSKTFTWSNAVRLGSYMLTIRSEGDADVVRQWLEDGEESRPFPLRAAIAPPTRGRIIRTYLALGYTHIVPRGADHIVFVLGIFLLSTRWKPVLLQVTAFTVAHTITLALTIYGLVSLSRSVVEPLIALSIVYVAVENLATSELKPLADCAGLRLRPSCMEWGSPGSSLTWGSPAPSS